jgi:hypothetical protein
MSTAARIRPVLRLCTAAATLGAIAVADTAYAASASAVASATLIQPVGIEHGSNLLLRTAASSIAHVAVLGIAGLDQRRDGATTAITLGSAAIVTVSGDARSTYAVTLASTVTAGETGGIGTVTITPYVIGSPGAALPSGRSQTVLLGGTLVAHLPHAQGAYVGSLEVMIEYN